MMHQDSQAQKHIAVKLDKLTYVGPTKLPVAQYLGSKRLSHSLTSGDSILRQVKCLQTSSFYEQQKEGTLHAST